MNEKNRPSLKNYLQRYHDFLNALQASRLISIVAEEALRNFPKGLPKKSRQSITTLLIDIAKISFVDTQHLKAPTRPSHKRHGLYVSSGGVSVKSKSRLASTALMLFFSQCLSGKHLPRSGRIDFTYRLRAQELVMLFAHLDAFFGDTLRIVCLQNPSILRRSKTLTWEEILACGNWEAVVRRLTETQAYEFGWKSTKEKLLYLERELGVKIVSPNKDLASLEAAEQVRHLVMHNNCRVSQEHLRRTGRTDINIGDPIPLTNEFTEKTAIAVTLVGSDLARAISKKFFEATENDLKIIWRRRTGTTAPD